MEAYKTLPNPAPRKNGLSCRRGFTLIELAFVLIITGVLLSMGVELLPMLVKQNKFHENRTTVKEVKTAVLGYALAKGRLPCADTNGDGEENNNAQRGSLPYKTLGISGSDAYTRTLYYAVEPHLTTPIDLTDFKNHLNELITGVSPATSPSLFCDGTNIKAAFVIFSAGANGTVDSPNSISGAGSFAKPGAPETSTYDDILDAIDLISLYGRLD